LNKRGVKGDFTLKDAGRIKNEVGSLEAPNRVGGGGELELGGSVLGGRRQESTGVADKIRLALMFQLRSDEERFARSPPSIKLFTGKSLRAEETAVGD